MEPCACALAVLHLLSEEERLLPCGSRGFREWNTQFLLWRELLIRGYKAFMEDEKKNVIPYGFLG
jgi:hypothetical protein